MKIKQYLTNKQLTGNSVIIAMLMCLTFSLHITAQNLSTGYQPGGEARNFSWPGGTLDWLNVNNVMSADSLYSSTGATLGSSVVLTTNTLEVDGFGNLIPEDAVIQGIEVTVIRTTGSFLTDGGISDEVVKLMKTGTLIGTNKAKNPDWVYGNTAAVYGGPTDLWGTTWTPEEINATTFGVGIIANLHSGLASVELMAHVDNIEMNVFYFTPVPLPLEISSFTGIGSSDCSELVWTTTTEHNIDYFVVEKKLGSDFVEIGKVQAVGNSMTKSEYNLNDCQLERMNYYRLSQVDLDGKIYYHDDLLALTHSEPASGIITPNPTGGKTTFISNGPITSCIVYNLSGKVIENVYMNIAGKRVEFDLTEQNAGVYLIVVTTLNGTKMDRITERLFKE